MHLCIYASMHLCIYARPYVGRQVGRQVGMLVCWYSYVGMHECSYVCMYVCIYIYICISHIPLHPTIDADCCSYISMVTILLVYSIYIWSSNWNMLFDVQYVHGDPLGMINIISYELPTVSICLNDIPIKCMHVFAPCVPCVPCGISARKVSTFCSCASALSMVPPVAQRWMVC